MSKKISFEEWEEICKKKHNNKYEYQPNENWFGVRKSVVKIICPIHGVFEQNAEVHRRGFGCKKCSDYDKKFNNKRRFNKEQFVEKAKKIHGNNLDFSPTEYINMRTKIKIKCNICGNIFETLPRDILNKHGCPICKFSRLEREIFILLKENNINFIWQYRSKWLLKQSLDFYLLDHNIAIECQGKQHFGCGFYNCKRFDFDKIKKYDENKRILCKENKIELIYYLDKKYNDFVSNLENKFFNNKNDILNYINQ